MRNRTLLAFTVAAALVVLLIGCASTHMKRYMGKDVREIAIDNGPPINVFDFGDGRRVFQWRWGGGTFVVPGTTTVTGSTTAIGNTAWYSATALSTPSAVISSEGCILSYIARWDPARDAWIVTEYRVPRQLVC